MNFQPVLISSFNSGLTKDKKPYLLIDDAFQQLKNAYAYRGSVKKRDGIKLVGRLRRCFTVAVTLTNQASGTTYAVADILADAAFALRATEPDANIQPGGVTVTVGARVFTDSASDGVLSATGANTGTINYATGALDLVFSAGIGATNVDVTFCYFPALPAMGIDKRELEAVNVEQTVWFDTKYVYSYNGDAFSSPSTSVWAGTDSDFFWMENYRGSTAQERLFFVTNNTAPASNANNRIRYTSNLATWTDFTPAVAGTLVTNEGVGTVVTDWTSFAGSLASTPIIPGSVTITVSNGVDPTVGFRDNLGTYPTGTLVGSASTNSGTIDYSSGAITLAISPAMTQNATVTATYQHETSFLYQAKLMVSYYGRLLALNVYEGANAGAAVNTFNRCRYSQVGSPVQQDAWISTVPGKGGFIDAPTNEQIVSARFYKNTLIVFFEKSTWELRYVGEVGLPFLWERISSDFGSESTFSTVLFDDGILAVGDKAIVSSSGNNVQRIDNPIPDTVFEFYNKEGGKKRVQGVRNFQKELVYWCYSEGGLERKFPNRVLLFNYKNGTFAKFRDNVTVFGELNTPTGIGWDTETDWDTDVSWDTSYPGEFPATISGNQQGWVHWYQYPDAETTADALTNMNEHESMSIKDITLAAASSINLEIINHNLEDREIIYITGLLFVDAATDAAVTTDLNEQFYQVTRVDDDNVTLQKWNFTDQQYVDTKHDNLGYTPDPADGDTYVGGGRVSIVQNMDIITKDFNPFVEQGSKIKMSYTDFMTDASPNSAMSVDLIVDSDQNTMASSQIESGNIFVGNTESETAINQFGRVSGVTQANPAVVTAPNHGLQTGQTVIFRDIGGMTELNTVQYTVTHIGENSYSIGVDSSAYTAYTSGGQWISSDNRFYLTGSNYAWHRFYATCYGQYISYRLFYDNDLMNTIDTHQSGFELNAIQLWLRQGGRLVL